METRLTALDGGGIMQVLSTLEELSITLEGRFSTTRDVILTSIIMEGTHAKQTCVQMEYAVGGVRNTINCG